MSSILQLNQNTQMTMMLATEVANLNTQIAKAKTKEEKLRLKEAVERLTDWGSRLHFIFTIGATIIEFNPHADRVTIQKSGGRLTFFDEETKKKLIIGYDLEDFANDELDKIYAGAEYRLDYFHLTELKFLGIDYLKLIKESKEKKEYNIQLNIINNKFKETVPAYSGLEMLFMENEIHKKIAEHNTNIYKKCDLRFLGWSIGTSIVGLIGLMMLLFVHIIPGVVLLSIFGVASLLIVGCYADTRDGIKKEQTQFTKNLKDELSQMKLETRVQIFDQEGYKKEIKRLNEKYAN